MNSDGINKMMNILLRNPADCKAKLPCDNNILYPMCVPGHDSPNGTTFLTIVAYDKQKTALVDDSSDLINTRRLSSGRKPLDCGLWHCLGFLPWRQSTRVTRSLGSSTRMVSYCITPLVWWSRNPWDLPWLKPYFSWSRNFGSNSTKACEF
jgi:hypothetical protein